MYCRRPIHTLIHGSADALIRRVAPVAPPAVRTLSDSLHAFRATLAVEQDRADESWAHIIDTTVEHPRGGLWIAEIDREPAGMLFAPVG